MPGALIDGHCIAVDLVRYEVDGWGIGELWLESGRVVNHELPAPKSVESDLVTDCYLLDDVNFSRSHTRESALVTDCYLEQLLQRIGAYFAGERVSFEDLELDDARTSPFQAAVSRALRAIPYGELVTYGELAALAGHPNAQRAAGTFCARNRFPLFIPCHRVVGADGLGSYGSLGLEYKRRLLELEGAI
jgi:methylated-DNA-[protein]-cysteine S-methyltransferase